MPQYTPPTNSVVDFTLQTYTPPTDGVVNFNFEESAVVEPTQNFNTILFTTQGKPMIISNIGKRIVFG